MALTPRGLYGFFQDDSKMCEALRLRIACVWGARVAVVVPPGRSRPALTGPPAVGFARSRWRWGAPPHRPAASKRLAPPAPNPASFFTLRPRHPSSDWKCRLVLEAALQPLQQT